MGVSKTGALPEFKYEAPGSWDALWALPTAEPQTYFLAGGTDLLIDLRSGKKQAQTVIDLKYLPELNEIKLERGKLLIGALCRISEIASSPLVWKYARALAQGAAELGSWQVRNRATIGGNLCNGSPTADTASPVLALGAILHYRTPQGLKQTPADAFWQGALKTALPVEAVLTAVEIAADSQKVSAYHKLGTREAMEIAVAGAAVALRMDDDAVSEARIAMSGAAAVPLLSCSASDYLTGRTKADISCARVGELAAGDSSPRDSRRATREYRLRALQVLTERALKELIA